MSLEYITKAEAEEKSGINLDGRRKYFMWNDEVCIEEKFTSICSGCADDDEYSYQSRGSGCQECGYHGVRRDSSPLPVKFLKTKEPNQ